MKRILTLLMISPLLVFGQKKLSVTGKIAGLKDGTKVYLFDINDIKDTLGRGVVKNGIFTFKKELKMPTLTTLNFGTNQQLAFFFDNSNVTITGSVNDLKAVVAKGSPTQDKFDAFQKKFYPMFEQYRKTSEAMQMSGPTDSLQMAALSMKTKIEEEIDLFLKKNNSSAVSSLLLYITYQLTDDIFLTEKRFASLKDAAKNNVYGMDLQKIIAQTKPFSIGGVAMDFTQNDTLDKPISLSSFRGKYVLLDFWASWCGPCRQENPNVVSSFNKFKAKNFTVLSVSLDRPGQREKWLQAIHADNLTWTHVSDLNYWSNAVAQQYHIESIPQNFLIGPDGKIIAKNLRGPALDSKLCELLGCN